MKYLFLFLVPVFSIYFNASGQKKEELRTGWSFLKENIGSIWEAVRPVNPGSPESVPIWSTVELPHTFNARDAVDPNGNYYQGIAWYKRKLSLHNPYRNGRTILHFEGSGPKTYVYLDTMYVGSHIGGYDEWSIDITNAFNSLNRSRKLKDSVYLVVKTDNGRDVERLPSDMSDFVIYGGIYRKLWLEYQSEKYIDHILVTPTVNDKVATLNIKGCIRDQSHSVSNIKIGILDPKGKVIYENSIVTEKDHFDVDDVKISNPILWSPSNPSLYSIIIRLDNANDTCVLQERIGLKYTEFVERGPFLLNGKRLLLEGTQRHEDFAGVGAAMTDAMIRSEMKMIKDMGANFIRLGHYQQSKLVLDLCDSLGILVWEEIPWCRGGLGGEEYQAMGERMLTNMITQHYNHPSVIIWGIGNENDWPGDFSSFDTVKIQNYMKKLNDLAHSLDRNRKTAIRRCDFCKFIPDIYSPSIWLGWYRGLYTEYFRETEKEFAKVPHFLHAEWGGDSHAGRHSEYPNISTEGIEAGRGGDERTGDATFYGGTARVTKNGDWSETYICDLFDWHLKEQEKMPWLTGTAMWVFKDFATPLRPENPIPYVNQKGVVERDLTPKESYYVFQSYWSEKPMLHIYGHSWNTRWGGEGAQKIFKVYSNCGAVELFLNGISLGVKKRNSQDFPAAGLRWSTSLKKGTNIVVARARKNGILLSDTIAFDYQTEQWGAPRQVVLTKVNESSDTVTIQVKLYDKNHIACLDARNEVLFSIAGAGLLLDDLGTSRGSRKIQLYNGKAYIKIKKNNGACVVCASIEGIDTNVINL